VKINYHIHNVYYLYATEYIFLKNQRLGHPMPIIISCLIHIFKSLVYSTWGVIYSFCTDATAPHGLAIEREHRPCIVSVDYTNLKKLNLVKNSKHKFKFRYQRTLDAAHSTDQHFHSWTHPLESYTTSDASFADIP
jgi:hypothetical protein